VIRQEVHDQEVLDRFFREARAAAKLRHPNIITIYASGQHEHQPYMVLEFVDGDSLADIVKERRPLPLEEKLSYIDQICAGLHFAHKAGIVHRDIKPANIMVDREGIVRILDFGIARIEGSAMTQDGTLIGSLNYMSPEQMMGRAVDHRSDIFSVGSVAYELLCYQQAFKGTLNDGLYHRLPNEDPPPVSSINPEVPPDIEQVINKALMKAPDQRFQNLADMRAALGVVKAGTLGSAADRTVQIKREPPAGSPTSLDFLFETPPEAYQTVNTSADFLSDSANALRASTAEMFNTPDAGAEPQMPASQIEPQIPASMIEPQTPASQIEPQLPASMIEPPQPETPAKPPATVIQPPAVSKPETVSRPPTVSQPQTVNKPATISKPPTVSKPPSTTVSKPYVPPPQKSGAGKWMGIGAVLLVVVGGAIVALPRLREQPNPVDVERPRVIEAMERFRTGYRTKNLAGVAATFTTMPADLRATMQKEFERCLVYEVTFSGMQVELNPDATAATVNVRTAHTCTPNSNDPQTTVNRDEAFRLQRQGENWLIDSASSAPAR
jgi:serine/threonine-protein kinase